MALEKSLSYAHHTQYIWRCIAMPFNAIQCQAAYRSLFSSHIEGQLLEAIRVNSNKGMAIGNEQFKQEIEALTGTRMKGKKMGRPANPQKRN
jgi:putative transposase